MIRVKSFKGKTIAVMGLGKSGLSTAKALMASGAKVFAWDDSEDRRAEAKASGIPVFGLTNDFLKGFADETGTTSDKNGLHFT